jgi:hypothetical protein
MASKTFQVKDYQVALHRDFEIFAPGGMVRCSGRIVCTGRPRGASADFRLHILFLPPDTLFPPNSTDFGEHEARMYVAESRFEAMLALLRTDDSMYAYVSDNHPLSNQIRTSFDPVDEI